MIQKTPATSAVRSRLIRCATLALALLLAATVGLTIRVGLAHAATFTVTNTDDSGAGSLRQAITDANATPNTTGPDTISFSIPAATDPGCAAGSGVCTISPANALPDITEAVTINGYSQSGASPNTLAAGNNAKLKIELNGVLDTLFVPGINITGPNSVVKGLSIYGWDNGVQVIGAGASGNRIEGNYIGLEADGTAGVGNFSGGVEIFSAPNNVVGGTSAGAANIISNSGSNDDGVEVLGSGATGNSILRNSIYSNGGLGIDLNSDNEDPFDVTPNDPQDPDPGPNLLQNFPTITSATTPDGQSASVQGTLNSNPNEAFTLRFFSSPQADPSGYGEGKTFLGQTNVAVNAGGNASFSFSTAVPVAAGEVVSATATNVSTGDTSEFSEAVEVADETGPRVVSTRPEDGARGVPARANVFATFSEAMRPSSINANTFKLFLREGGTQTPCPPR